MPDGSIYHVHAFNEQDKYEKIAKRKSEIEDGLKKNGGKILLDDWAKICHDAKSDKVSPQQYNNIRSRYNKHISPEIGRKRIQDILIWTSLMQSKRQRPTTLTTGNKYNRVIEFQKFS